MSLAAPRINEELMRLGIAALRSGRFKKGIGFLHTVAGTEPGPDDRHCCLGVLSIIAKENGCPVASTITGTGMSRREMFGNQNFEFLSDEVMRCYGFESNNPMLVTPQGVTINATYWNDSGLTGTLGKPGSRSRLRSDRGRVRPDVPPQRLRSCREETARPWSDTGRAVSACQ
jgi:hypothetical protein